MAEMTAFWLVNNSAQASTRSRWWSSRRLAGAGHPLGQADGGEHFGGARDRARARLELVSQLAHSHGGLLGEQQGGQNRAVNALQPVAGQDEGELLGGLVRICGLGHRNPLKTCGSKPAMDSHAEVRATHRRNGLRWSAHLDLRCILAPKDI